MTELLEKRIDDHGLVFHSHPVIADALGRFQPERRDSHVRQGMIGRRQPLFLVNRILFQRSVIVEMKTVLRGGDLPIHLVEDPLHHCVHVDGFAVGSDKLRGISDDGLAKPHGVSEGGFPFRRIEPRPVVKIEEEIAPPHQAFNHVNDRGIAIRRACGGREFPVHVTLNPSRVFHYREEIRPWNHDQVAFPQGEIRVEIRGKVPPRLVALNASQEQQGRAWGASGNEIDVQFGFSALEIGLVEGVSECRACGGSKNREKRADPYQQQTAAQRAGSLKTFSHVTTNPKKPSSVRIEKRRPTRAANALEIPMEGRMREETSLETGPPSAPPSKNYQYIGASRRSP